MDAALASILERGFYRASTNEIARRAGVTWGVIQHHFGTREALMVAVLRRRATQFTESAAQIELLAEPGEPRLRELFDILAENYGDPEYLAWLQILINLRHDPECSPEIGEMLGETLRGADHHVGRLIRQALGPAGEDSDFRLLVFSTMRGLSLSELLLEFPPGMSIPGVDAPGFLRQRDLLVEALVGLAAVKGLSLHD
jgi:AcrR family transcriptional regulator